MTQDDFPNIKEFMEHCREYFGKDIRPTYINENGKEAGQYYDYEKTAIQPVKLDGFAKVKK